MRFTHSTVCLTRSPQPLPKRVVHTARSSASCFNLQHPFTFLRSFSSCLRLLLCLPVASILYFIFLSVACFRRQFLRKIWPVSLSPFCFSFTVCMIFLFSLTLCNIFSFLTRSVRLSSSIFLQYLISKISTYFWSNFRNFCVKYAINFFCTFCSTSFTFQQTFSEFGARCSCSYLQSCK